MKKFKFNLEPLLVIRDWEEQRARQVLAEANAQVHRLGERIQEMRGEIEKAYSGWQNERAGTFTPMERMTLASQIAEIERKTAAANGELTKARARCGTAMEALRDASRNKKVVKSLKEKRLQDHAVESLKQEAAEMENIYNARRSAT